MEFELDFDPTLYSRLPPYLDLATTLALARQLTAAIPAQAAAGAKRTGGILSRLAQQLESAMIDSLEGDRGASNRPVDLRADRSWAALEGRLASWCILPAEAYPEVEEASVLHQLLFSDGLRFTQLEYGAQWAEAESRIGLIRRGGYEATLERLCGRAFVDELLSCHAAYGAMVGITRAGRARKAPTERPDLNALRKRVHQAILAYQIQLVAMCMSGDAEQAAAGRQALRPIDDYREKLVPSRARPGEAPQGPVAAAQPVPPSPTPSAPPPQ